MKTLQNYTPALRRFYVTLLVIMWVAATIANVVTIFGLTLNVVGLVGISVFVGAELVRSTKDPRGVKTDFG